MDVNGGSSTDSIVGGDATTNGRSGNVSLAAGATGSALYMNDGDGPGAAPSDSVRLFLEGGSYSFGSIEMTDRPECWIQAVNNTPVMLKVQSMPGKATLNNSSGAVTNNLSADLDGSVYFSGVDSNWYALAGTLVMD